MVETEFSYVLPPPKRILPGRPKKKRRLEAWEMNKNVEAMRMYYAAFSFGAFRFLCLSNEAELQHHEEDN